MARRSCPVLFLTFSSCFSAFAVQQQADSQPAAEISADKVETSAAQQDITEKSSPWLFTPTFSSDPKVATSVGALVAYIHKFDEKSPASMFATMGTYSSTDSYYYGGFAKTYFGEDHHRLSGGAFWGQIKNDYDDYLGTGLPAKTNDNLAMVGLRYQYQVVDYLYLGIQGVSTDYAITAGDLSSGDILDWAGIAGFHSNALGLVVNYDKRDNQNSPTAGFHIEAHNLAYRESFGGDSSFDVYAASAQYYLAHAGGFVTAINSKGRWTVDADPAAYSSVELRGYVRGQYLRPHMTMLEVEERISLYKKWGMSVFTGVAFLYGDKDADGFESEDQFFPAAGAGVFYQLNDEKMVVRAEFAVGKDDNHGFYLNFGQPF